MRKRNMIPAAIMTSALVTAMALAPTVGSAWAYFTTNTNATGGVRLALADEVTQVEETFGAWTKQVTVTNTDASGRQVYVRAKAFSGSLYGLECSGDGWSEGEGGYWYYERPLEVYNGKTEGESNLAAAQTSPLNVKISGVPTELKDADGFNVAVVYETTPVQYRYDANGALVAYADWDVKLDIREATSQNGSSQDPGNGGVDNAGTEDGGTEEGGN